MKEERKKKNDNSKNEQKKRRNLCFLLSQMFSMPLNLQSGIKKTNLMEEKNKINKKNLCWMQTCILKNAKWEEKRKQQQQQQRNAY